MTCTHRKTTRETRKRENRDGTPARTHRLTCRKCGQRSRWYHWTDRLAMREDVGNG
jgi:DNA-directed RNA polymerase subunit M/transcription elongation factor TFIIS